MTKNDIKDRTSDEKQLTLAGLDHGPGGGHCNCRDLYGQWLKHVAIARKRIQQKLNKGRHPFRHGETKWAMPLDSDSVT